MDPRRLLPAPGPQSGSRINAGYLGTTVGSEPIIWLMGFPRAARQHPADPSPTASVPRPPRRSRRGRARAPDNWRERGSRLQGPHCSASRGTLKMLQDLLPVKTAWEGGGDPRWRDIILLEAAQITQGEKGCLDSCCLFLSSFFFPPPPPFFSRSFPPLLPSPGQR